jgi:hypothetical protein
VQPGSEDPDQCPEHTRVGDLVELGLGESHQRGVAHGPNGRGTGQIDEQSELADHLAAAQFRDHDVVVKHVKVAIAHHIQGIGRVARAEEIRTCL